MPETEGPRTFRIPISFSRFSIINVDKPNRPILARITASKAKYLKILADYCLDLYILSNSSSKKVYSNGWSGRCLFMADFIADRVFSVLEPEIFIESLLKGRLYTLFFFGFIGNFKFFVHESILKRIFWSELPHFVPQKTHCFGKVIRFYLNRQK